MKSIILFLSMMIVVNGVWGQSNELLDKFLAQEKADVATSMLFLAQVIGDLPMEATPMEGYTWGTEQKFGQYVTVQSPDDTINLGLFYLALLKTFDIKGGFMFNAFGTPRYAANEAVYFGYVDPSMLFHTRSLFPYEVLTGISYLQEDMEAKRLKDVAKAEKAEKRKTRMKGSAS